MIDLVPRTALDVDEPGFWRRSLITVSVLFGVTMGLFSAFMPVDPAMIERYGRSGVALTIAVVAGPAFGAMQGLAFRRILRRTMDKVYAGKPPFEARPPSEVALEYRLPASLRRSAFFAVGGVLYIGPTDVLFVPHAKRGTAVRLGSPATVKLASVDAFTGRLWRFVTARPSAYAEMGEPGRRRSFVIPAPSTTLPHLRDVLDRLGGQQS